VATTNVFGCMSAQSAGVTVTVNKLPPNPVITVTFSTFCSGGKATLTSTKAASYQWYKDGLAISGAINKTYKTKIAGSYTVAVKNVNGCETTSDATVLSCSSAAMATTLINGQLTVNVLPNPSKSDFTLLLQNRDDKTPVEIRVLDIYGRSVYNAKATANQYYKFGQSFLPGTYIVAILQGNTTKTIKIVKLK